jgi:hypothetical protein
MMGDVMEEEDEGNILQVVGEEDMTEEAIGHQDVELMSHNPGRKQVMTLLDGILDEILLLKHLAILLQVLIQNGTLRIKVLQWKLIVTVVVETAGTVLVKLLHLTVLMERRAIGMPKTMETGTVIVKEATLKKEDRRAYRLSHQ